MRKSVIFVIAIIYIVSMAIVTFFGLRTRVDQFRVYFASISITNYDTMIGKNKYKTIKFDETEGYSSVFISYKYSPENVSYPDAVKFSLTNNTYTDEHGNVTVYAEVTQFGEIVFYKKAAVTVWVEAKDGSAIKDSMLVICK